MKDKYILKNTNEHSYNAQYMVNNTKYVKFILSVIFTMIVCLSLHAVETEQNTIFIDSEFVAGKEYLYVENTSTDLNIDSSHIYIADNAKIYGKENLVVKQNIPQTLAKNSVSAKTESAKPVEHNIAGKESREIVLPDFPSIPSSSYYSYWDGKLILISKQNYNQCKPSGKKQGNPYSCIENSNTSLHFPAQRQKLSIAAIQCGILTCFSPNSPTVV